MLVLSRKRNQKSGLVMLKSKSFASKARQFDAESPLPKKQKFCDRSSNETFLWLSFKGVKMETEIELKKENKLQLVPNQVVTIHRVAPSRVSFAIGALGADVTLGELLNLNNKVKKMAKLKIEIGLSKDFLDWLGTLLALLLG